MRAPGSPTRSAAAQVITAARRHRGITLKALAAAARLHHDEVGRQLRSRQRITPALAVAAEALLGLDAEAIIRAEHESALTKRLDQIATLRHSPAAGNE